VTIHDRLRATTQEIDEIMYPVRPLALPPAGAPARLRGARAPRALPSWVMPFAAAAAIVAVAVSLVAVRALPGAPQRGTSPSAAPPAAALAGLPRYAVLLKPQGGGPWVTVMVQGPTQASVLESLPTQTLTYAVLADTRTGKTLTTVRPPSGYTFTGVTGAGNGRAFVLDATQRKLAGGRPPTHIWFELTPRGTPRRLPAPVLSGYVDGIAVSPDGATLAVSYLPGALSGSVITLATYSLGTGRLLRTWTGPKRPYFVAGGDASVRLSWLADGRTLAYQGVADFRTVYLLDTTKPGDTLPGTSRAVFTTPVNATYSAGEPLVASDGQAVWLAVGLRPLSVSTYSTATGKLLHVMYSARMLASVLWAESATTAIAAVYDRAGAPARGTEIGVVTQGKFTPLHLPLAPQGIANSYGFSTIAF